MHNNELPTRGGHFTDPQRTVIRILLNAVALVLTAGLFESIYLEGFFSAVLAVMILAFINAFIRPIFLLLTLPLTVMTLGLFTLVINATLFKLTSVLGPRVSCWWILECFGRCSHL